MSKQEQRRHSSLNPSPQLPNSGNVARAKLLKLKNRKKPVVGQSRSPFQDLLPTRQQLIRAAIQLFAEKGFNGASVKQITDLAKVNISLVSYHFGSKEELYRESLRQMGQEKLDLSRQILTPPSNQEELKIKLRIFYEGLITSTTQKPCGSAVLRECEFGMQIAKDVFEETFLKIFETLIHFFAAAQDSRLIKAEFNPQVVASVVHSSVLHMARFDAISSEYLKVSLTDPSYRSTVLDHLINGAVSGFFNTQPVGSLL